MQLRKFWKAEVSDDVSFLCHLFLGGKREKYDSHVLFLETDLCFNSVCVLIPAIPQTNYQVWRGKPD